MKKEEANVPGRDSDHVNKSRREFLRNSVYAAYATPLITALLIAEESAARSGCPPPCQWPDPPGNIDCSGC